MAGVSLLKSEEVELRTLKIRCARDLIKLNMHVTVLIPNASRERVEPEPRPLLSTRHNAYGTHVCYFL